MFNLTDWQKQDLKWNLAKRICGSEFNCLEIYQKNEGMSICVDGDVFGLISAISHVIQDMSSHSEIPAEVLATYVYLAVDILSEVRQHRQELNEVENEDFTMFMDVLNGKLKENK